jgi:hypothetical protein
MAVEPKKLRLSRRQGLAYLVQQQRADGGFDSFSSPSSIRFDKAFTYQTTFVPALILTALSRLHTTTSRRLSHKLSDFMLNQRSPAGSFNYWSIDSPERLSQPYPDDLDDTACALIGLFSHRPELVGPPALASFVKVLLATEVRIGGPYRTWLVPPETKHWSDTDLAVNANIAYLLSLVGQPLPNVTHYIERAIRSDQLQSPYYASTFPVLYYIARGYRGPLMPELRALANRLRLDRANLTPLQTALLLSTLVHLGADNLEVLATDLLASQSPEGSWPVAAFCLDPAREGIAYYHGSESLTTALALEALQAYAQTIGRQTTLRPTNVGTSQRTQSLHAAVTALNQRQWQSLRPELRTKSLAFTQRLAKSVGDSEIIVLPQAFNESLKEPLAKVPKAALTKLSLANVYGWTAYTIYDDFLDEEGQPDLLSVATLSLRYCLEAFDSVLPGDQEFHNFVRQTFNTIDGANAWELEHCRFERQGQQLVIATLPDYSNLTSLADRSLGHSLTPLAILRTNGLGFDNIVFRGVRQALVHYLTARQLNDDAHDWQVDLQNGHITYVVSRLLTDAHIPTGPQTIDELLPVIKRQFWHETLSKICHDMSNQVQLSRLSLARLPGLKSQNILTQLLDDIDASVTETLKTQSQTQAFLKHYATSTSAAT